VTLNDVHRSSMSFKLATHYTVSTGRGYGPTHDPWTRVSKMSPVFTGHVHGPWTRYSVYRASVSRNNEKVNRQFNTLRNIRQCRVSL